MRGKPDLLKLVAGLLLYFLDLGSDIYVAVQYYNTRQWWWFIFTSTFIVVPMVIINIAACIQIEILKPEGNCLGLNNRGSIRFLFYILGPVVVRYIDEFKQWKILYCDKSPCDTKCEDCQQCNSYYEEKTKSAKSTYRLTWISHIGTVTESAPQWCLQVYIMLRQWYFPCYTMVSAGLSLLFITWSITALQRAQNKKNHDDFTYRSVLVFFIWQLAALVSRLSGIVLCAYALKQYVFVVAIGLWILAMLHYDRWFRHKFDCKNLLKFLYRIYPTFFNASRALLRVNDQTEWKTAIIKMNITLAIQNILMLIIFIAVSECDDVVLYAEEIRPIALSCVLGGLAAGTVFCLLYFSLQPTRIGSTRTLDASANDALADDAGGVDASSDVGPTDGPADGFPASDSGEHSDI